MKPPKVSVIMPVYNGEMFVRDAINSILDQTFQGFELIVINDGSSDSSAKIITSYTDPRIVFINNDSNMGLPYVRNQGLDASRGEYIAWLDCDDTSLPDRLERQVRLLDKDPQIGVCGASVKIIGEGKDAIAQYPADPEYIRASLLFNNCLANSTVMMRAACTREIGIRFDLSHHLSQDYGLWTRIPKTWKITNLPDVLTTYRLHSNQVTEIYKKNQIDISWEIQKEQLSKLGIVPTTMEMEIHMSISGFVHGTFINPARVSEAKDYLIKLDNANNKHITYNKKAFREVLLERWLSIIRSRSASEKLKLKSYWMLYIFGVIRFGLTWRTVKIIGRIILNDLKLLLAT